MGQLDHAAAESLGRGVEPGLAVADVLFGKIETLAKRDHVAVVVADNWVG